MGVTRQMGNTVSSGTPLGSAADLSTFPISAFISILITVTDTVHAGSRSLPDWKVWSSSNRRGRSRGQCSSASVCPTASLRHQLHCQPCFDRWWGWWDFLQPWFMPPGGDRVTSAASSKPPGPGAEMPGFASLVVFSLTASCLLPSSFLMSEAAKGYAIFRVRFHEGFYFTRIKSICISL